VTEIKIIAAGLVLISGVLGGLLARRLTAMRGSAIITSLANTFAGGVFLGAALLHMLPDAIDHFDSIAPSENYPIFALVGAFGFLGVLLMDKVLMPSSGTTLKRKGSVYPYLLMITLSIHSVITGIAMGLERETAGFIAILVAVFAHKTTAAMALAISFEDEKVDDSLANRLLAIFYTTTPIGILTGTWIATLLGDNTLDQFEAVFDAIAAGTFLYIAVMDILAEEFEEATNRWKRYWAAAAGFAVMAVVAIWT
jgi:solute carrier family 39 (zinc transporter), member 1/2/3